MAADQRKPDSRSPRPPRPLWLRPVDRVREYVDLFLDGEAETIDYILFLLIFIECCVLLFLLI